MTEPKYEREEEITIKYIADYILKPDGEKELVKYIIPGMENVSDNISDKHSRVVNYSIEQILSESEELISSKDFKNNNDDCSVFNTFRILENLDNALKFIQTDANYFEINDVDKIIDFKIKLSKNIKEIEGYFENIANVENNANQGTKSSDSGKQLIVQPANVAVTAGGGLKKKC